jgi:DNA-binding IclR family transcriptional regulator
MGQSSVKSAERTMEVLNYLSSQARPVLASSISRQVGLPKSSTYHLLNVMLDKGFVYYFPEERVWGLGPVATDIGSGQSRQESLRRLARPLLRELASSSGEPAVLAVLSGSDSLILDRAEASGGGSGGPVQGERLPSHLCATGRALLMDESEACVRRLFPSPPELPLRTLKGPRRTNELIAILAQGRQAGYACEESEIRRTDAAIAAPVHDHLGKVTAAVGVTFWPRSRDRSGREMLAAQVMDVASAISGRLGFRAAEESALAS